MLVVELVHVEVAVPVVARVVVQVAAQHKVHSVAVHKPDVVVRRSANVAKIKTIRHR